MNYAPPGNGMDPQNNTYRPADQAPQGYSPYGQPPQYRPPVFNYKRGGVNGQPQSSAGGDRYASPQVQNSFTGRTDPSCAKPSIPYMPGQQMAQYAAPNASNTYAGGQYSRSFDQYAQQTGYQGATRQPANGYVPGQNGAGYFPPQPQQGFTFSSQPGQYTQQPQNGPQEPYRSFIPPTPGMPQPQQSEPQPQSAYIPQTPYSPGSGTNAYQQAFGPYTQPVREPEAPPPQYPLNGGGYVPKQPPIKRQPFVFDNFKMIILSVVLVACFALGMFVPGLGYFKWIFTGISAVSIIWFWVRNTMTGTKRLCFSVVFGALIVISVIAAINASRSTASSQHTAQKKSAVQQFSDAQTNDNETVSDAVSANRNVYTVKETAVPTEIADNVEDVESRLNNFFFMWSANKMDEMLEICLPSWQRSVDSPKTALFGIMANRTPLDYTIEKVSGGSGDTSRTVTLTSTIDRNNGKQPVKYRFSVIMVNEDGQWYVDPRSLSTNEEITTPDPAETVTSQPTIEPVANASTILYYNPDGGTKYHLDPNCKSTHEKFLPMTAHFTYAEVNDPQYAALKPCNVCAAPLRQ